jgi:hypothetical protein
MSIFLKVITYGMALPKPYCLGVPKYSYSLLRVLAITPFQGVIKTTF